MLVSFDYLLHCTSYLVSAQQLIQHIHTLHCTTTRTSTPANIFISLLKHARSLPLIISLPLNYHHNTTPQ